MYQSVEFLGMLPPEPPLWKSHKKPMAKQQKKKRKKATSGRKANVQRMKRLKN